MAKNAKKKQRLKFYELVRDVKMYLFENRFSVGFSKRQTAGGLEELMLSAPLKPGDADLLFLLKHFGFDLSRPIGISPGINLSQLNYYIQTQNVKNKLRKERLCLTVNGCGR